MATWAGMVLPGKPDNILEKSKRPAFQPSCRKAEQDPNEKGAPCRAPLGRLQGLGSCRPNLIH